MALSFFTMFVFDGAVLLHTCDVVCAEPKIEAFLNKVNHRVRRFVYDYADVVCDFFGQCFKDQIQGRLILRPHMQTFERQNKEDLVQRIPSESITDCLGCFIPTRGISKARRIHKINPMVFLYDMSLGQTASKAETALEGVPAPNYGIQQSTFANAGIAYAHDARALHLEPPIM
mmetsp:Transcript_72393/g.160139  ORF Transcript_72393/g.160139 Transcript_72393/m.160139 type:complete len:174 (-) Transcript_72393:30-551(-)